MIFEKKEEKMMYALQVLLLVMSRYADVNAFNRDL